MYGMLWKSEVCVCEHVCVRVAGAGSNIFIWVPFRKDTQSFTVPERYAAFPAHDL